MIKSVKKKIIRRNSSNSIKSIRRNSSNSRKSIRRYSSKKYNLGGGGSYINKVYDKIIQRLCLRINLLNNTISNKNFPQKNTLQEENDKLTPIIKTLIKNINITEDSDVTNAHKTAIKRAINNMKQYFKNKGVFGQKPPEKYTKFGRSSPLQIKTQQEGEIGSELKRQTTKRIQVTQNVNNMRGFVDEGDEDDEDDDGLYSPMRNESESEPGPPIKYSSLELSGNKPVSEQSEQSGQSVIYSSMKPDQPGQSKQIYIPLTNPTGPETFYAPTQGDSSISDPTLSGFEEEPF